MNSVSDSYETISDLKDEIGQLKGELNALRWAAENMLAKLDEIVNSLAYQGIFGLARAHGIDYSGPTWEEEYHTLNAALQLGPRCTNSVDNKHDWRQQRMGLPCPEVRYDACLNCGIERKRIRSGVFKGFLYSDVPMPDEELNKLRESYGRDDK